MSILSTQGVCALFQDIPVTAMILSAQFWPTFREENLQLPDIMQRALDNYTKGYETLKGNRTLCWKNHLGMYAYSLSNPHQVGLSTCCKVTKDKQRKPGTK